MRRWVENWILYVNKCCSVCRLVINLLFLGRTPELQERLSLRLRYTHYRLLLHSLLVHRCQPNHRLCRVFLSTKTKELQLREQVPASRRHTQLVCSFTCLVYDSAADFWHWGSETTASKLWWYQDEWCFGSGNFRQQFGLIVMRGVDHHSCATSDPVSTEMVDESVSR